MELSTKQIQQIDNYVASCGIKFHEVKAELVDHFANILEKKLAENPKLDFKKEIIEIHKSFSKNGFQELLKQKTKSVEKLFYKQSLQHLLTFFKLPKIILSIGLFFGLYQAMLLFEDKQNFFYILLTIAMFLGFRLLFNVNMRDTSKEKFLILSMTLPFYNVYYGVVMLFQFFDDRSVESFANPIHNGIHIFGFLITFIFCWCGEYVYYKNKKELMEKYPNVLS